MKKILSFIKNPKVKMVIILSFLLFIYTSISKNYEKMMFGDLNPNYLLKPEWQCRIAEYFFKGLSNIFSSRKVDPIPLKVQYESFCKWIRQYKANNLLNKQMVITILPIKKKRGILLLLAVETNPLIAFTCSKMYFQIKRL